MEVSDFMTQKIRELFDRYKASGGTQSSLARACGANQSQVSVWLKGGYLPSAENLPGLAKAFGVPITSFFPDEAGEPALTGFKRELFDLLAPLDEEQAEGLLSLFRQMIAESRNTDELSESQMLNKKTRR